MEANLLDRMLEQYQRDQTPLTFTLQNKTRVHGKIKAFDSYVIVMENQMRAILYRHAVSCLAPSAHEARKQVPEPRPVQERKPDRNAKPVPRRSRPVQQAAKMAAASESGINTGMREGLLKWMQEQKAK